MAAAIDARSRLSTLATLTANPAVTAACPNAVSSEAGPKRLVFSPTTPRSWLRPVTSARAARLGRYPSSAIAARTRRAVSTPDVRVVVEHPRDRLVGNACQPGDVHHRGFPRALRHGRRH